MKSRKLFAALLCALLCLLMAGVALAADESPVIASGDCGDNGNNVTWKLTEDGTLTISGTGTMKDYYSSSSVPWYSYRTVVKNAVIESGVTGIGEYAFYYCSLTSIILPDSVTSIGSEAFYGCSSLKDVYYQGNIVEWLNFVFSSVTSNPCYNKANLYISGNKVTDIIIPDSVTSIGSSAFSGCSSLTSITIPDSVTSIGDLAFFDCSSLTSITIPNGVTGIGNYAFEGCSSLTSITIPNGVTVIGDYAFEGCSSLTSFIIPDSVTSIGEAAFYYCSSLTSITIPDGVTSIRDYAFEGCSSLTSITIPDSVTSISDSAFSYCSSLTSITIPDSVTSIGYEAFYNCSSLRNIFIPSSVQTISAYSSGSPFYGCSSLTIWTDAREKQSGWDTYWNYYTSRIALTVMYGTTRTDCELWSTCDKTAENIIIPDGVTFIPDKAFYNCGNLTSIILPDGVTSIGSDAFYNCSSLMSIILPDSLTSIGDGAFSGCSSLKDVYYQGNIVEWLNIVFSGSYSNPCCNGANIYINGNMITDITIPDGVSTIGNYAFYYCSSLTSITIPDSVTSIGSAAFSCCSSLTSIILPDSVTSIGGSAFYGCSSLTSIKIPDSLTSIGSYAFYYCSSLTSIAIPDSVTSIGSYAFYGCSSLTNIAIPDGVTKINNYTFNNCSSLKSIFIPSSVQTISASHSSDSPFYGCDSLTIWTDAKEKQSGWGTYWNNSRTVMYRKTRVDFDFWNACDISAENIIIPDGVTFIPDKAFYNCGNLKSITIPDSVTSIGNSAFSGCSSLTSIILPDGVTSIGKEAFYRCSSLTSIILPDGVTSIGIYAFYGCSSLTSVTIPDSVTSIGSYAFCCCSSLTSITIPESVTGIDDYAFYGCSSLTSIILPDSVTGIGRYAFNGCSSLTSITIPDSVTSINEWAFYGCCNLTSVTILNGVTEIGESAFFGCSSLTSITIPDSVTSIIGGAFSGCCNLTSVTFLNGVTEIGEWAFNDCSSLTSINIPDGVTSIRQYTFYGCDNLNLYLPDNISSIGAYALYNVSKIFCNPHTITSASVVEYGNKYYAPGNDDFYLTETNDRVKVNSYSGSCNSVIIPDGINEWIYSDTVSAVRLPATLCETDVFTLSTNSVTVPEGVSAMGTLSLSGVQKIFIPASVTDMSGVNITDGSVPTVYCEMDSEAELWAIVNGYGVVYTDAEGWDDECSFGYIVSTYPSLDVGETFTLSLKDFIIEPMPAGEVIITLVGDEYVTASGMTFTAVKPGDANPQAVFGTHKVTVPMHVYQTPTYMKLEVPLFAQTGAAFNVTLTEAAPADISGKFTWQQDGGIPVTDTVLTHTFTAPSRPGSTVITVTAPGGYTKSVTVTVAGSISAPYAGGNSRAAVTGSFIDICVDVDGVTYRNTAELYGEVTVPATAAGIIELTEDGRAHVIGSGRTAFSVTGLDGKKVNFIVVASEAGGVLTLPAGTLIIGEEAFAGTAAQKAVLPAGCVSIGSRAFAGSAVQIVNVPASVTSIADDAFSGCSVTVYCPAGSYAESWCAAHYVNCVAE